MSGDLKYLQDTLAIYYSHNCERRALPWRTPDCPPDVFFMSLALLEYTDTPVLESEFKGIFTGISTFGDWLKLTPEAQKNRLSNLPLPWYQRSIVTSVAMWLDGEIGVPASKSSFDWGSAIPLIKMARGETDTPPPTDAHIIRVASRLKGDPKRFLASLTMTRHRNYDLMIALKDIGELVCHNTTPACLECPLSQGCEYSKTDEHTSITVRFQAVGFHHWPDAPDEVMYLRKNHRHLFKCSATVPILKSRQIEFHILQSCCDDLLCKTLNNIFETASCEEIGNALASAICSEFPEIPWVRVTVSEDGENDATVRHFQERNNVHVQAQIT